jgi:hypothetical protein
VKAGDAVDANQTVFIIQSKHSQSRVRLGVDVVGWLPGDVLADTWLKVWKRERKLLLMKGDAASRSLRIALGSAPTNLAAVIRAEPDR